MHVSAREKHDKIIFQTGIKIVDKRSFTVSRACVDAYISIPINIRQLIYTSDIETQRDYAFESFFLYSSRFYTDAKKKRVSA